MNPTTTISVIIPTKGDRPELLERALESVRQQQLAPDEVFVVCDRASHAHASVAEQVGSRAHTLRAHARGVSAVRNAGVARARGDFVAFLDDDDAWSPEHLALVFTQGDAFDFAVTSLEKHRPNGDIEPYKSPLPSMSAEELLVRNPGIQGSNLIVRRESWVRSGGCDEQLHVFEDMDLGIRLLDGGARYRAVPEAVVAYHCHRGPRLTMKDSPEAHRGARRFLAKWGHRMSSEQRSAFRARASKLWGDDPGELGVHAPFDADVRILWVGGPPGAGKSTYALTVEAQDVRIIDLGAMLAPLQRRDRLTKGMRAAKRYCLAAIRAVAHAPNTTGIIVVTLADVELLEELWPERSAERFITLLPEYTTWQRRLEARGDRALPSASMEVAAASYRVWCSRCQDANIPVVSTTHRGELMGLPMDGSV